MKARVVVTLKPGVLDPQGQAIEGSLGGLGFTGVSAVRQGKIFDLEVDATDAEDARSKVDSMCTRLLANTVIENYSVEISE
ncbi:phosphoribosylformylglycinamidine synthase subunit PurS [Devosia pacifica]|uniref:Phosphoribosylformylglycinamidine synthase subunit PurS n=1 Tax=Devosia pacifica TaxID=1335967 RepID=A0A918VQH1_9HYPH|nr:phosphoribosylformylglycinamidine synthase subunit PurS [Devosia pacifica]GHA14243.1 phosphoribosylformylglycinamidine synthase subunit PurS [Devosia pacifica]